MLEATDFLKFLQRSLHILVRLKTSTLRRNGNDCAHKKKSGPNFLLGSQAAFCFRRGN
jgi:hypothetical protein